MATSAAAKSYGFEWRTLLGPTHNWSIPTAELSTTKQQRNLTECCELCCEQSVMVDHLRPILQGKERCIPHVCAIKNPPARNIHRQREFGTIC